MMNVLKENGGIPRAVLLMMSAVAGITVANLYYNQPLLELIRQELQVSEVAANLITVITQVGYALGLFFIVPMGDLYRRRNIILGCMLTASATALAIAFAPGIMTVWVASLLLGATSIIPQLFIPVAGQFSKPENKSRNMGYVLSGLLTGILASRVVSGFIGHWLGWRVMFLICALLILTHKSSKQHTSDSDGVVNNPFWSHRIRFTSKMDADHAKRIVWPLPNLRIRLFESFGHFRTTESGHSNRLASSEPSDQAIRIVWPLPHHRIRLFESFGHFRTIGSRHSNRLAITNIIQMS